MPIHIAVLKIQKLKNQSHEVAKILRQNGNEVLRWYENKPIPEYRKRLFQKQFDNVKRLPTLKVPEKNENSREHLIKEIMSNMSDSMLQDYDEDKLTETTNIVWKSFSVYEKMKYHYIAREDFIRYIVQMFHYKKDLDVIRKRLVRQLLK